MKRLNPINPNFDEIMILRTAEKCAPLRLSRSFNRDFGFSAEDLAQEPLMHWIHPDDQADLDSILEAGKGCVMAKHRTSKGEWHELVWRVKTQDGSVSLLGSPYPSVGTELNPLSHTTQRASPALKRTLEATAHAVEAKNPGLRCSILLVDPEGQRVTVGAGPSLPEKYNSAVEGLCIGPAVGSCGTAAFWSVPVVVENIHEDPLWRNLRDTANVAGVRACWSVPIITREHQVLGAMALYADEPSEPLKWQIDLLEISASMIAMAIESDYLELRLREAAKMEALGVMAGGVAHDFNNLLTVIMGNAELAALSTSGNQNIKRHLEHIVTASTNASDLCTQLLAFTGRGSSTPEPLDVNELVEGIGSLLQVAISKKVSLEYQLYDAPLAVIADRSQLRQVLMNLITNASDAYGKQSGEIIVRTNAAVFTREDLLEEYSYCTVEPGEYALITVSDSGTGMTPKVAEKIFDPFFSTKKGGRGVGLSTVKGIVDAHRGGIAVKSKPDQGTAFTIIFPIVEMQQDEKKTDFSTDKVMKTARILIGEDESLVRDIIAIALDGAGYEVIEASDGQEVLDLFSRDPAGVDCVLLDLNMPKLDGEEVFAALRKIRPNIPVILSSGFTARDVLARFEGQGLAGFLHKPVSLKRLLNEIGRILEEYDQ
ncbi:MAG: response regulator [Halioglobus sp.]|nr:response regulator [Halioglobus sp.]